MSNLLDLVKNVHLTGVTRDSVAEVFRQISDAEVAEIRAALQLEIDRNESLSKPLKTALRIADLVLTSKKVLFS